MAARGEAERPGYSREKISFADRALADGEPVDVLDLRDMPASGRKPRSCCEVPAGEKRTVAIDA